MEEEHRGKSHLEVPEATSPGDSIQDDDDEDYDDDDDEESVYSNTDSEPEGGRLFQREMGIIPRLPKIPPTWDEELATQALFTLRHGDGGKQKDGHKLQIPIPQASSRGKISVASQLLVDSTVSAISPERVSNEMDNPRPKTMQELQKENDFLRELLNDYAHLASTIQRRD